MSESLVVTIILNTNRREDTLACLASLEQSTYKNNKVIVLDNASGDGSVEAIRSSYPWVQIIQLEENLGYAGNNNVGIEAALAQQADWIFVLNEDTILDPDCLTHLVRFGESDSQIGVVGPLVYHHDEPDIIQSAGGMMSRFWESLHIAQNEPDQGQFTQPHPADFISGCAILFRRAVIEQVGLYDKRFFYYKEETELCLRARKSGWLIVNVPQAKLWHKGVQRDYHPKPSVTYYSTRNRYLMFAKHKAPLSIWVWSLIQTLRTLTSWTIQPKWRGMHEHRNAMWNGVIDFLRHRWGKMPQ